MRCGTWRAAVLFLGSALCPGREACRDRAFEEGETYLLGPEMAFQPSLPHVLLAEDLDRDGVLDLATLNRGTATVGVLRGRGDGTFEAPEFLELSSHERSVFEGMAAGDLTGNGFPDLVCVDWELSELTVVLNHAGLLEKHVTYRLPAGAHPHGVVLIDVDGGGGTDILSVNDIGGSVSVFLNHGSAELELVDTTRCGIRPQAACALDLDGDGDPDFAVANAGLQPGAPPTVSFLLNDGAGALSLWPETIAVSPSSAPVSALSADLDHDGNTDVVIGSWTDNALYILWKEGPLRFSEPTVLRTPGTAVQAIACDFDGDTWEDLAVCTFAEREVAVFWNQGGRRFLPGPSLPTGLKPRYPAAGDFDLDGDMDIASTQWGAGTVSVFLNSSCMNRPFVRGDGNADGKINMADAMTSLGYLFARRSAPQCYDSADSNDDGKINISDALYLLGYLFGGRRAPPPPFPSCGTDPTPDTLTCAVGRRCAGETETLRVPERGH